MFTLRCLIDCERALVVVLHQTKMGDNVNDLFEIRRKLTNMERRQKET